MAVVRFRGAEAETDYFADGKAFFPAPGKVLIARDVVPEKDGQIIIPEIAKDRHKPLTGHIAAIGRDVDEYWMLDDYVHFGQYAGTEIDVHTGIKKGDVLFDCILPKDMHLVIPNGAD